MRTPDPDATVVTHTHKTVRRQFIDLRIPPPPPDDEEAFILRNVRTGGQLVVRPTDLHQLIACCSKALSDATSGTLS